MRFDLSYLGRSGVEIAQGGLSMTFAPNLSRPKVFFDGAVRHPLRYREAMSALHAVVVGDSRFIKRSGGEAYEAYKKQIKDEEEAVRSGAHVEAQQQALADAPDKPPDDLNERFCTAHRRYWRVRRAWATELYQNDPALWRSLVPCDPVVTVAPDVVFFEGFAKDETSYGCLFVDRDAFEAGAAGGLGTTNVDYSMDLFEQFQLLRTYRPTRLLVDPTGFDVKVEGHDDHREEKIDLPPSWLKGFGQLQAAMTLPATTVSLDVPAVYAILRYLAKHREKKGPRALRFELVPGSCPKVVIEPWGHEVESRTQKYDGDRPRTIKVWGRRRLKALARLLPLAERVDVRLLDSGLPSIWVVRMGEMRFVLGLSGWTTNDWSSGAALDLLSGVERADAADVGLVGRTLQGAHFATASDLRRDTAIDDRRMFAALHTLAKQGQVVYDFARETYRWRPVMPIELSEAVVGPDHPELIGAHKLVVGRAVTIVRDEIVVNRRIVLGRSGPQKEVELALDLDGRIKKGRCGCNWHFANKIKKGPCQHLLALRMVAEGRGPS